MASTPLTLAALATSAVPGLMVNGAQSYTDESEPETRSVLLDTDRGTLIVRVPETVGAETRQTAEMFSLSVLAEGAREALPFQIPETLGVVRAGQTRAVVTSYLTGGRITAEDLVEDALLLQPIAEAIAAIHALPPSLAQQLGLTARTAEEVRAQSARLVQRAAESLLLPETVHARWLTTLGDPSLWDFAPTLTHGALDADHLLVEADTVAGVLGWSSLALGDPAADLAWLGAADPEVLDSVLTRYSVCRGVGGFRELRTRTLFAHELEVAKWLIHGLDTHDQSIIDDAVAMLDRLVDDISRVGEPILARSTMSQDDVVKLLEEMPELPADSRSETAEFEALDEDRDFALTADLSPLAGGAVASQPLSPDTESSDSAPSQSRPGESPGK